jgi:hypothetical protein
MDHLLPADFEGGAGGNGNGRRQTQPSHRRERLFSYKLASGEKRNRSFLPGCGNHSNSCAARLKIKDRIRRFALRKEGFLRCQVDNSSSKAGVRQESCDIAGVDLGRAPAPDETTILQFRHLLEKHDLGGAMADLVRRSGPLIMSDAYQLTFQKADELTRQFFP